MFVMFPIFSLTYLLVFYFSHKHIGIRYQISAGSKLSVGARCEAFRRQKHRRNGPQGCATDNKIQLNYLFVCSTTIHICVAVKDHYVWPSDVTVLGSHFINTVCVFVSLVRNSSDTGCGHGQVRYSSDTSQTQARHMSDIGHGQRQVRYRSKTGQIQVRHSSDTGQAQFRHRSSTGQTQVRHTQVRHRSGGGDSTVDRQSVHTACESRQSLGRVIPNALRLYQLLSRFCVQYYVAITGGLSCETVDCGTTYYSFTQGTLKNKTALSTYRRVKTRMSRVLESLFLYLPVILFSNVLYSH